MITPPPPGERAPPRQAALSPRRERGPPRRRAFCKSFAKGVFLQNFCKKKIIHFAVHHLPFLVPDPWFLVPVPFFGISSAETPPGEAWEKPWEKPREKPWEKPGRSPDQEAQEDQEGGGGRG